MFSNSSRKISLFLLILCAEAVYSSSNFEHHEHVYKEYLAARQVYVYKAYKDMQIFHFNIPPHISGSIFNLTSNNTEGCSPRNITVYLQAESYPVVSPDGATFPEHAWVSRQTIYQATLLSDLVPTYLSVEAPHPGDWFMVAFIFDDSNRITQAGIFPSCYAWLQVEASYYHERKIDILETQGRTNDTLKYFSYQIEEQAYFSFFVPLDIWHGNVEIIDCKQIHKNKSDSAPSSSTTSPFTFSVSSSTNSTSTNSTSTSSSSPSTSSSFSSCPISVVLRPSALPFPNAPESVWRNCSVGEFENCGLPFTPVPGTWHYILVIPNVDIVAFEIGISLSSCGTEASSLQINSPFIFEEEFIFSEIALESPSPKFNNASVNDISLSNTSVNDTSFTEDGLNVTQKGLIFNTLDERLNPDKNYSTVDEGSMFNLNEDMGNIFFNNIKKKRSIPALSKNNISENNLVVESSDVKESVKDFTCGTNHVLTRKTFPGNFVYEYDLKPNINGSVPLMLNLSNQVPTILSFDIQSIIDIGGTLSVDIALSPFTNTTLHNYTVFGCLNVRIRPSIENSFGGVSCNRGKLMVVNSSDSAHYSSSLLIPYPEPGRWFYTLFPSCYLQNQSSFVPCSTNVTTVIFSIASASCVMGKCGDYGSCFQYISGGFIFSTCVCDVGYRGYDCSDGSHAVPDWKLLLSTLLLCLSNLFFLPAILLALYRKFYTEALVYAFTMFFSTFYHACDQDIYNFCMLRLSVLQFCDFYSAILSFWVTLIVMANLPQYVYSILHMAGAVIVALGVEYDRTGLWVFAIPSISALFIMCIAWIIHTKKEKSCYPPRKYWVRSLIPGTVLAATGLICYAFLETEDNYYIIHSIWHAIMALSILCLLPPRPKSNIENSVEDGDYQASDAQVLTVNLNL